MGIIQQLDEQLSNQIAAGEVVERPASVVKELIENAFDAGADRIRVDLQEGGLAAIRVTDNGSGIAEDDLERAFFRHATSKIVHEHDLFRIKTLGFRGEALPSIASVSQVNLVTSDGREVGHEITVKGGAVIHRQHAAPRKGTDVTVTDLFYNTPARLKYLRTIHTEVGHVSDIVNRMALSRPDVAFTYSHNGKNLLQTSGNGDVIRVIASIYGIQTASKMLPLKAETKDFKISGYVAKPEVHRANRSYMTILLNQRYVKSYPVMKAIQAGFHTLLPIGKFPVTVLMIEVHPHLVDVNVHPSKLEVRLSKEQELQQLVTDTIKDVFAEETLIPRAAEGAINRQVTRDKSEQVPLAFDEEAHFDEPKSDRSDTRSVSDVNTDSFEHKQIPEEPRSEDRKRTETVRADANKDILFEEKKERQATHVYEEEISRQRERVPKLYPIGQHHGTYILAENESGLYLIDQHAAQERILYEYFREKVDDPPKTQQDLLVPYTIELTNQEHDVFVQHKHEIERMGISVELFGQRTYLIRSVPVWFPDGDEEAILYEWLEQLKEGKRLSAGVIREEAAILMACKAAIKANRHLRSDEMERLLDDLRSCEDPFTCPHGRPVIIHYSTHDIERMFKRVM